MSYYELPDRWLDYSCTGKQIGKTPFVAFKVPLRKKFFTKISLEEQFGPDELMKMLPDVSLVIDLTNTEKYYSDKVFSESGIEYQKIKCPGRAIPTIKLLKRFFAVVDDFLSKNNSSEKLNLIGVHCTHGVNRTGFFICCYMIKKLGYDSGSAISEFNLARGHDIERIIYIKELQLCESQPIQITSESEREITSENDQRNKIRNDRHLGYRPRNHDNNRNGKTRKTPPVPGTNDNVHGYNSFNRNARRDNRQRYQTRPSDFYPSNRNSNAQKSLFPISETDYNTPGSSSSNKEKVRQVEKYLHRGHCNHKYNRNDETRGNSYPVLETNDNVPGYNSFKRSARHNTQKYQTRRYDFYTSNRNSNAQQTSFPISETDDNIPGSSFSNKEKVCKVEKYQSRIFNPHNSRPPYTSNIT